ncbi:hypothetical protein ACFX19_000174 [Malus domestica]
MLELPVAPLYTSPIFLPHLAPPSVVYSDSIDVPQIPHSYATNPNFHDPQIYSPSSYEQHSWVFYSENRLRFHDPHEVSPYNLDLGYDSTVHTAPATNNTTQASFPMLSFAMLPAPSTATTPVATTISTDFPSDVTTVITGADPSALCTSSGPIKRRTCYECCEKVHLSSVCPKSVTPTFSTLSIPVATTTSSDPTSPTTIGKHTPIINGRGPDTHMHVALRRLPDAKTVAMADPAPSGPITNGRGLDTHMPVSLRRLLDAKTVAMEDPAPSGQVLLHKRKMKMVSGYKVGRRVQGPKPIFRVRQRRAKCKLFDKGRSFGPRTKDIPYSNITAKKRYLPFQFDILTLVGDQPWAPLCYSQRNAVQLFDEMPKGKLMIQSSIIMEVPSTRL